MSQAANPTLGGRAPQASLVETDLVGRLRMATEEAHWVRYGLIAISLTFLTLVLFVPLVAIFAEAFRKGVEVYFASFTDRNAVAAIWLTLVTAAICVPLNLVFGLAAAWARAC
jgi:sulfate transport system permease protein